jgi:F0F1-type ATP synthase assembly protein I
MARQSQQDKSAASRAAGLGWELAGAVAGFALLGYWIDRHFASSPWGLLICIALGLIGGTYNLIRASLAASRQSPGSPASPVSPATEEPDADGDPQDR